LPHFKRLLHVAPNNNDHHPAIRCALGVGVPLLFLLAISRPDLSIFAVLGAFTAMYGRGERHRLRLIQQIRAGGLLFLAIGGGTLTSLVGASPAVVVLGTAVVAGVGHLASRLASLRTAGSLFFVFAYSAAAFTQHPAAFGVAVTTAGMSVLFSILVGTAGWLIPGHRTPWVAESLPGPSALDRPAIYAEAWLHVMAVALSGGIAIALGLGHGYWAMVSATVPLVGISASHGIVRGLQRIVGTMGGLVIAGILLGLPLVGWQVVIVIVVLQFLAELFVTRNYALGVLFVTPLALLMTEAASPTSAWVLVRDRGVETVIGASIGIACVASVRSLLTRAAAER
jgi:hypothetical protein